MPLPYLVYPVYPVFSPASVKIELKLDSLGKRVIVAAGFLVVLILFAFSTLKLLANAVAQGADEPASAEFAAWISPDEPYAYYISGFYLERSMRSDDLPRSLEMYDKAAALEPFDYLLWLEYGKALERNGRPEDAEKALKHAESVAPNYSEVQWALGNVLIRNGKADDGFAHLRKAVEGNKKFAKPAASLAWDIFEGDVSAVERTVGDSNAVKASVAAFLSNQGKFDESLRVWRAIPEAERRDAHSDSGKQILNAMLKQKRYALAAEVQADLSDVGPRLEKVSNGGFEAEVASKGSGAFEWNIAEGKRPTIGISVEQKRSGGKSLAVIFGGSSTDNFRQVSQAVAVRPETEYRFKAFYRSDLKAEKTMYWQISDANSGKVLAESPPFESESDWVPLSASFLTASGSEGIVIKLLREKCTGRGCQISGRVWLDDVSIEKE